MSISNERRRIEAAIREKSPLSAVFGRTWFVGNVTEVGGITIRAMDALNHGSTFESPFASLDYAIGNNNISDGDTIVLLPGHVEELDSAVALDIDKKLNIIGLGRGADRPTFAFSGNVAARVTISADGVVMSNFLATCGINNLAVAFQVTGEDVTLRSFEMRDTAGPLAAIFWILATDTAHRLALEDFVIDGIQGTAAISLVGCDRPTISDCFIYGDYSDGLIVALGDDVTRYRFGPNLDLWTTAEEDLLIVMSAASTGMVVGPIHGRLADDAANITEAIDLGDGNVYGTVQIANADSEAGLQTNITPSADA